MTIDEDLWQDRKFGRHPLAELLLVVLRHEEVSLLHLDEHRPEDLTHLDAAVERLADDAQRRQVEHHLAAFSLDQVLEEE